MPSLLGAAFLRLPETPKRSFGQFLQPDPRIISPSLTGKFHTLRLICIFPEVHAPVENDLIFFSAEAANAGRLFDTLKMPSLLGAAFFLSQTVAKIRPVNNME